MEVKYCPKCESTNVALKQMNLPGEEKWVCSECGTEEYEFPKKEKEERGEIGVLKE